MKILSNLIISGGWLRPNGDVAQVGDSVRLYLDDGTEIVGTIEFPIAEVNCGQDRSYRVAYDREQIIRAGDVVDGVVLDSVAEIIQQFDELKKEIPQIYNVTAFGAVHDGVTDDSAAINAAIDAAYAAKGGTVFFPNGHYIVSGDLINATNSILGPSDISLQASYTEEPLYINFLGEAKGSLDTTCTEYVSGVVLDARNGPTSGDLNFAVISSGRYTPTSFNPSGCGLYNIFFSIDSMLILTKDDPAISGINMSNSIGAYIGDDLVVNAQWAETGVPRFAGWGQFGPVLPDSGGKGIIFPQGLNNKRIICGSCSVMGFDQGIVAYEHLSMRSPQVGYCRVGLALISAPHMNYGKISSENNNIDILVQAGAAYIDITLDIECGNTTTSPGAWWTSDYNLVTVSGGMLHGRLNYLSFGGGTITPIDITSNFVFPDLLLTNLATPNA